VARTAKGIGRRERENDGERKHGNRETRRRPTTANTGRRRGSTLTRSQRCYGAPCRKHKTSGCFSPSYGTPDRLPVDGAATGRRNDGDVALLGLGFGRRSAQSARVHGWDSGRGGCLNRPGSSACGPGGSRARGRPAWGRALPPVRLRPKVGDDERGPPIGDCGRAAAGMGRNGRCGLRARLGWRQQRLGRKGELGCARGGKEMGCCGVGLVREEGKVCFFFFPKFLFPPKTNKQL
jgi:hypothetical protein